MGALALIAWATLTPDALDSAHHIAPAWCFACGGLWLTDALSNIALFVPLGVALALLSVQWPMVMALALATSLAVEVAQYVGLPPGRSAALADVAANTLGALLGVVLTTHWHALCRPSRRHAAWYAVGWATLSALVMLTTAFAVTSPVSPRGAVGATDASAPTAPPIVASTGALLLSARTHPPGYGWYGGRVDSARVIIPQHAPLVVRRGWGGPIILQASRSLDSLHATTFVRGRDENTAFVPVLYVHAVADSAPLLMVGQHDGDAELRVTRRASDFGLRLPSLRLPGAFAARPVGDTSTLQLIATLSAGTLALSTYSSRGVHEISRSLDATNGWALLQSVIEFDSPMAPVVLACWLAALIAPVGWWAGCSVGASGRAGPDSPTKRPARTEMTQAMTWIRACVWAAPLVVAVRASPALTGVSAVPAPVALLMFALFMVPFAVSARLSGQLAFVRVVR